eukprot:gene26916-4535_t
MSTGFGLVSTAIQECSSYNSGLFLPGTIGGDEDKKAEQAYSLSNASKYGMNDRRSYRRSLDDVSSGTSAPTSATDTGSCNHNRARQGPAENPSHRPKQNSFRRGSVTSATDMALYCSLDILGGISLPTHASQKARSVATSPYLHMKGSREHPMIKARGGIPQSPRGSKNQSPRGVKMSPFEVMLVGARDFQSRGIMCSSPQVSGSRNGHSQRTSARSPFRETTEQRLALGTYSYSSSSKSLFAHPRLQAEDQTKSRGRSLRILEQALEAESNSSSSVYNNPDSPNAKSSIRTPFLNGVPGGEKPMETNCRPIHTISSSLSVTLPSDSVDHRISPVKDVFYARFSGASDAAGCSPASEMWSMIPGREQVAQAGDGRVEGAHAGTRSSAAPSVIAENLVEPCKGIISEPTEEGLVVAAERKEAEENCVQRGPCAYVAEVTIKKTIRESARLRLPRSAKLCHVATLFSKEVPR